MKSKDKSSVSGEGGRITAHDVARRANVAIGTVSRVVNDAPGVSPEIRQRVLDAIEALGWVPSVAAQSMRGVPSRMVGFIFSDIRNPIYSSMVKGAEEILSANGFLLVTASSNGDPDREVALIDLFRRRRADALLFSIQQEDNLRVVRAVEASKLPVVMIERDLPIPVSTVNADHFNGTRQAIEHLLQLGHRRIAIVSGGKGTRVARDRLAAFTQTMQAAGLTPDEDLLFLDSYASDYAFRQTQYLLSLKAPPTAIMALGMRVLPGVLSALQTRQYKLPNDVSLIAGNDSDLALLTTPRVTAIRYDPEALGREAALVVVDQLNRASGEGDIRRIEIQTELVLRESCAPPRHER